WLPTTVPWPKVLGQPCLVQLIQALAATQTEPYLARTALAVLRTYQQTVQTVHGTMPNPVLSDAKMAQSPK
ncbi:hypothetical protein HDU99_000574, partial [Rhizoclosmatium hyalinum]